MQYVKELSASGTLSIRSLAAEAEAGNHRLSAPLALYAAVSGKGALLSRSLGRSSAADEMRRIRVFFMSNDPERILNEGNAPRDCLKVWEAFLTAKNAAVRDKDLKEAIRKKVIQLKKCGNCSNYRIYTDLKLNPGNVNSWLKNGDGRKISCKNAELILDYVRSR
ncbi:MAG: hypothetical protein IJR90_08605 [Clostridia bacterium]|nr:hypothetical protein [Clostridia bacterium]